jgi:hypothetical protein
MKDAEDEEEDEEEIASELDPEEGLSFVLPSLLPINRIYYDQKQVMIPTLKKRMKMLRKLQRLVIATPN